MKFHLFHVETTLKFKSTFNWMTNENKLYDAYFHEKENGKRRIGPLLNSDWESARCICKIFKIFYNATL